MKRRQIVFSMLLLPSFISASSAFEPEIKELLQTLISDIELIEPSLSSECFDNAIVARAEEIADAAKELKSKDAMASYLRKQIDSDFAQHRLGELGGVTMPRTDLALQYLKFSQSSRWHPRVGSLF